MDTRVVRAVLLLVLCHLFAVRGDPLRLQDSVYPAPPQEPANDIQLLSTTQFSNDDERFVGTALQGILARVQPQLYLVSNSGMKLWLQDLVDSHSFTANSSLSTMPLSSLLTHFRSSVDGYVLCNSTTDSCALATSIASALSLPNQTFSQSGATTSPALLPAPLSTQGAFEAAGIPMFKDVSSSSYCELFSTLPLSAWSPATLVYQVPPALSQGLADYAMQARALLLPTSDQSCSTRPYRTDISWTSLLGWGQSEFNMVSLASNHSALVNAADYATDLSLLAAIGSAHGVQWPILQPPLPDPSPPAASEIHTVSFLFSDGDNIQALLNSIGTSTDWWGSPDRGSAPIGWTMSPAMLELAPTVLQYYYNTSSRSSDGADYFVAAPSGIGYVYPDTINSSQLPDFVTLTSQYMNQSDLHILNVLAVNGPTNEAAAPFLEDDQIDALFWYLFSNYAGVEGAVSWFNGKPCIGARAMLWDGFNDPASLAHFLNEQPRDVTSTDGYSLISVHLWDQSVDTVLQTIEQLDEGVEVVLPNEFVGRMVSNVPH